MEERSAKEKRVPEKGKERVMTTGDDDAERKKKQKSKPDDGFFFDGFFASAGKTYAPSQLRCFSFSFFIFI